MKSAFGKLLHGGDYNPEQWLDRPDILEKDVEYFKKAHINVVSLGIFSWSMLEPKEGEYHFEWLAEIIDRLYAEGISVILATPTGARPKWMADKYPEVLRVDEKRVRQLYGHRHNHCYTSPVYRKKTRKMNMLLAREFGDHPAVIAWHISNEYGGECHCELCQQKFREWVQKKYQTIERLNQAWACTFWSHIYDSFDQIESPSSVGESLLHGLNLDWKRFVTEQTVDFARAEIQAIRDGGSDKPTTVNLMYDYKALNYHKFADAVDVISWDSYPQWHKKEETWTAMDNGMQHDIMRSIKKQPFLMMESCPAATNWQSVSKLKKPGILELASLQAIAHGSDSVQYFQMRQSRGASEKFHGAVIDHYGGDDTRVFAEVTRVGEALLALKEVAGSTCMAQAAVLFDWENRWAMEDSQGPRNDGLFYKEAVQKPYAALRKLGLNVDMIDMEQEVESYQLVVCPMLYMFKPGFAEKMRSFVERGGTMVMTYWSGIVDDTDLCYLGGTPHGLMDVLGVRSTEIDGLYDGEYNSLVETAEKKIGFSQNWKCTHLCDLVKVSSAKTLAVYGRDFYAGAPVLTENEFGKGKAYYICADFEQGFYDELLKKVIGDLQIDLPYEDIPEGVEVTTRVSEEAEYTFIQNYNPYPVSFALSVRMGKMIFGSHHDGKIKPFGTIVLKRVCSRKGKES